jgi:ABC-type transport system substrate-binding protein
MSKMRAIERKAMLLLLAMMLGLFVLAACSSDDDPTPTPAGPADSATATPVPPTPTPSGPKVDRLVFGIAITGETNNPQQDTSLIINQIQLRAMYEYLIGLDPNTGQFRPELATEWTIENEGTAIRFKLREGVKFHGGWGEFTSADVIFTFELNTAEDAITGNSGTLRRLIGSMEAVGDHEVVINLTTPDAEFLSIISEITVGGEIASKAHGESLGVRASLETVPLAGTGPYEFFERVQGERIVFKRFDDYWGEPGDFAELEWRNMPEASSRLAGLRTGEIMAVSALHPLREGWDPSWAARFDDLYGFDPAAAEALIRDAGFTESNPLDIRILSIPIGQLPPAQDVVETIWAMWNDLPNVDISLDSGDPQTFSAQRRAQELEEAAYIYATSSYTLLGMRVYNSNTPPFLGYSNAEMDVLHKQARASLDAGPRDALIRQWGEISFTQFSSVPLYYLPVKVVVNPDIVADYNYPGNISGSYTHLEEVIGVR